MQCVCGRVFTASKSVKQILCKCGRRIGQLPEKGLCVCGEKHTCSAELQAPERKTLPASYPSAKLGVGAEIRKMLGCGCQTIPFRDWDLNGVDWCSENIESMAKAIADAPKSGADITAAERIVSRAISVVKAASKITTRNLAYHICPTGDWRLNVDRLLEFQDAFNGKRVVAIAQDSQLEPVEAVQDYIRPLDAEVMILPNCQTLREVATFLPLLLSVKSTDPNTATFYAHTKGNTTNGDKSAAVMWRNVMYDNLLGRWQECMAYLPNHSFVGTHKMIWPAGQQPPYPTKLKTSYPWMHAGTFYWFRHDAVFSRDDWQRLIVNDRYGAEAWPGQLIPHEQAKSMWQPWEEHERAWPQLNPYDLRLYEKTTPNES